MTLRRTLLDLVLATALPLAGTSGCLYFDSDDDDDPCTQYDTRFARVAEPPPADLEMLVRACEADPVKCIDLCAEVLARETGGFSYPDSCEVTHDATGHDLVIGYYVSTGANGCPVEGRRPPGLARAQRRRAGRVATHLARSAWFEAASVHAFVGLARELSRHGAPPALTRAAQIAATDEVRHARAMSALARARGATPPAPEVAPMIERSIEDIATENAVEGLVGETWAALVATWQGAHAPADVRETFSQIAVDETRHAELSREVHAWARTRMTKAACRRVEAARRRAVRALGESLGRVQPTLVRELGMPDAAAMQRLYDGARVSLFA